MKLALLSTVCATTHRSTYEKAVLECSETTKTTGPHNFAYSLRNLYQTAQLVENETELKVLHGTVPDWLHTHWYRTGPGKFEFGSDKYQGLADPMAMFQRTSFKNGKVTYQSRYQKSVHHQMNEEAGKIVTPEMSTWGQPENVTTNQELSEWLQSPDFVSDNAYVSFFSARGRLFASGETYHIWEVDPVSLKGLRRINMAKLLPETMFANQDTSCDTVVTHLAHTKYDPKTDELFASITCMTGDTIPKITYVLYKIPRAGYEEKLRST